MKKKNDPPDYPGDEVVNKAFGEALREGPCCGRDGRRGVLRFFLGLVVAGYV